MGDPRTYHTDGVAGLYDDKLRQVKGQGSGVGVRGKQPPTSSRSRLLLLRLQAIGTMVYAGPTHSRRRKQPIAFLRQRLDDWASSSKRFTTEFVGPDATHGALA